MTMSTKNVILKPVKKLILPNDIPFGQPIPEVTAREALKNGMALPARRVGGKRIPVTPAGMGVFAKYAMQMIDKAGKPVSFRHPVTGKMVRKFERACHSFTRNFGFWIRGFLQNLDTAINLNETLTDDAGSTFLCRLKSDSSISGSLAGITGAAKIKFGNSNAALVNTQFNLQGTLLGPTTEAATVTALVVEDSVQTIFTVTGQITNGTGGAFSVEEMGLFPELTDTTGTLNRTTMMLRDLTGTVPVANGQTIIGTYTFTIAV
jgi:hypothetical protein